MTALLALLSTAVALLAIAGLVAVIVGAATVRRFAARHTAPPISRPPVTVLKPLCGDEPRLEAALVSICNQTYPDFQIVFGVQSADDPALDAVRRVQASHPDCDIAIIIDAAAHGANRKVANLLNMMPSVKHDILVFSDSDLHVGPDYLDQVVAALAEPQVGLVTTICLGLPTAGSIAARLGATGISHCFLPGVLLSRALGRADCLGTTMALHRDTLASIGGLHALVPHVGDDNVLGRRVHRLGLRIALASTVPMTAVPERTLQALWQHELRWARTIRALEPLLFATSVVQFPLFWAALALVFSAAAPWSLALCGAAWLIRLAAARSIDHSLGAAAGASSWLLPLRDALSVAEIVASYAGARVVWRGHTMRATGYRPV